MKTRFSLIFLIVITFPLATSCDKNNSSAQSDKVMVRNRLDFPSIENKFKYEDLVALSIDTIQWDRRKNFYSKLDSISFFQIYQDTTEEYIGQYSESIDLDFFYSKHKTRRKLFEFTILSQREGEYCDKILYNIYDLDGKLISSFKVATSCGDGGYYEIANGRFLNDSTYELLSENNYQTKDVDKPNIITYSKTITTIKQDGSINKIDTILKHETGKAISSVVSNCDSIYTSAEIKPKYDDEMDRLYRYISKEIIPIFYSCIKRDGGPLSKLYIVLTIDKKGRVSDVEFQRRSLTTLCSNELKNKLFRMDGWKPAEVTGHPVCSKVTIPISCLKFED